MNRLILNFVASTLAKASDMNRIVSKINEIVDEFSRLGKASLRNVDTGDVPQDSVNLPTSHAVFEFVKRFASTGSWKFQRTVPSVDDLSQSVSEGEVYVSEDDNCANVVIGNSADQNVYVIIDGQKYAVDTRGSLTVDEFVAGTQSGQIYPFAQAGFTKVGPMSAYGYKGDVFLVPVQMGNGYAVVMCSSDTIKDGRCIRKVITAPKVTATGNSAILSALNTGEVIDWSSVSEQPDRVGIMLPFGGHVDMLTLATKEFVESHQPNITVDAALSSESTNPVQNKAIAAEIGKINSSLVGVATTSWVTSQGYLTQHQSLDGYATQKWVNDLDLIDKKGANEKYAPKNNPTFTGTVTMQTDVVFDGLGKYGILKYDEGKIVLDTNAYATTSWVTDQGYLTSADISGKADKADLNTHTGNTTVHITSSERTLWNTVSAKVDKSDPDWMKKAGEVGSYDQLPRATSTSAPRVGDVYKVLDSGQYVMCVKVENDTYVYVNKGTESQCIIDTESTSAPVVTESDLSQYYDMPSHWSSYPSVPAHYFASSYGLNDSTNTVRFVPVQSERQGGLIVCLIGNGKVYTLSSRHGQGMNAWRHAFDNTGELVPIPNGNIPQSDLGAQIFFTFGGGVVWDPIGNGSGDGSVIVDAELSSESTNPVQNKAIAAEVEKINSSLAGVATQSWVTSQGYLTQHQSLDGYATQKWVNDLDLIDKKGANEKYAPKDSPTFSGTVRLPLTVEFDGLGKQGILKYNEGEIALDTNAYATQTWVTSQGYLTQHQSLDGYATQTWVTSQGYLTQHQSLDGYATQEWVNDLDWLDEKDADAKYAPNDSPTFTGTVTMPLKVEFDGLGKQGILKYNEGEIALDTNAYATQSWSSERFGEKPLIVTHAVLLDKAENGTLVPGQTYRITDYECSTKQNETRAKKNLFDIIVVADTNTAINENALACKHEGDTYFDERELSSWRLKYCLKNDVERFSWACKYKSIQANVPYVGECTFVRSSSYDAALGAYDIHRYAWLDEQSQVVAFSINADPVNGEELVLVSTNQINAHKTVQSVSGNTITVDGIVYTRYEGKDRLASHFSQFRYCWYNADKNMRVYLRGTSASAGEEADFVYWGKVRPYSEVTEAGDGYIVVDGTRYNLNTETDHSDAGRVYGTRWTDSNNHTIFTANRYPKAAKPQNNIKGSRAVYDYTQDIYETASAISQGENAVIPAGKGVIYWLQDDAGNECEYDFKNIQFLRSKDWMDEYADTAVYTDKDGVDHCYLTAEDGYYYTFTLIDNNGVVNDRSTMKGRSIKENVYGHSGMMYCNKIGLAYLSEMADEYALIDMPALPSNIFVADLRLNIPHGFWVANNEITEAHMLTMPGYNAYANTINTTYCFYDVWACQGYCQQNVVSGTFKGNRIKGTMVRAEIRGEVFGNIINGDRLSNVKICSQFSNNKIDGAVEACNFIGKFNGNKISGDLMESTISGEFQDNTIEGEVVQLSVSGFMRGNKIDGKGIRRLNVPGQFEKNVITGDESGTEYSVDMTNVAGRFSFNKIGRTVICSTFEGDMNNNDFYRLQYVNHKGNMAYCTCKDSGGRYAVSMAYININDIWHYCDFKASLSSASERFMMYTMNGCCRGTESSRVNVGFTPRALSTKAPRRLLQVSERGGLTDGLSRPAKILLNYGVNNGYTYQDISDLINDGCDVEVIGNEGIARYVKTTLEGHQFQATVSDQDPYIEVTYLNVYVSILDSSGLWSKRQYRIK